MNLSKALATVGLAGVAGVAQALPPDATYDVSLTVAGSSAQQEVFRENFLAACDPATRNIYQARLPGGSQSYEFYAYSCRLRAGVPGAGSNAIVYYRSEGGAVYGYGAIAKSLRIKRLIVNSGCIPAAYPATGACPIGPYTLLNDSATGLADDTVTLATSDVDPEFFTRPEHWPAGTVLGTQPTLAQHGLITRQLTTGTVLGVLVNASSAVTDLSRQDVYSILSGVYGDWMQIATPANTGTPFGEIAVCRRTPGASEQIAATIYFNRQGCGVPSQPMVTDPTGPWFGNPFIDNSSASRLGACVAGNPNAIGIRYYTTTPPTGTQWVSINGVQPSRLAAALGDYDFWYESSYVWNVTSPLSGLAAHLLTTAQNAANLPPTVDSALALSWFSFNFPAIPVDINNPVTLGTRNGNSCRRLRGHR
jgi:hypothetical protein